MKKPFYKRIWVIVLALVLALMVIAWLVLRTQVSNIIENQLRAQLDSNPNSLYVINFEKLKLNIIKGDIKLHKVSVSPRKSTVDSLSGIEKLPSLLANVRVEDILLQGIDFKKAISDQQVSIRELTIHDPQIALHLTDGHKRVKEEKKANLAELIHGISRELHSSSLHQLDILQGEIKLYKTLMADSLLLSVENFDVGLREFRMDSSSSGLPFNLASFTLNCERISSSAPQHHNIDIRSLKLYRPDSSLTIESVQFTPKVSKEKFMAQQRFEKGYVQASTKEIRMEGFLPLDVILNNRIFLKSVSISQPNLKIYKDKNLPWPSHLVKEIPSQMIRRIPIATNVPLVKISEGSVLFQLKPKDKNELAELPLSKFYVSLFNLTNDSNLLAQNQVFEASVQGNLFDGPKMRGTLQFDMLSPQNSYTVNATLGTSEMKVFNSMLSPTSGITINEGLLNEAQVKLNGNTTRMWGTLDLDYKNANIEIFKEDEQKGIHKLGLLSFAANTLVRSNNVKGTPSYQTGLINFERTMDYPFIRFLWFSIFEGLKDTLIGSHNSEEEVKGISSSYVTSKMKKEARQERKKQRKSWF